MEADGDAKDNAWASAEQEAANAARRSAEAAFVQARAAADVGARLWQREPRALASISLSVRSRLPVAPDVEKMSGGAALRILLVHELPHRDPLWTARTVYTSFAGDRATTTRLTAKAAAAAAAATESR